MGWGGVDSSDTRKSCLSDWEHLACRANLCLANQRKKNLRARCNRTVEIKIATIAWPFKSLFPLQILSRAVGLWNILEGTRSTVQ